MGSLKLDTAFPDKFSSEEFAEEVNLRFGGACVINAKINELGVPIEISIEAPADIDAAAVEQVIAAHKPRLTDQERIDAHKINTFKTQLLEILTDRDVLGVIKRGLTEL